MPTPLRSALSVDDRQSDQEPAVSPRMAPRHYHADCSGWHDRQRLYATRSGAAAVLCIRRGSSSHRHAQGNPASLASPARKRGSCAASDRFSNRSRLLAQASLTSPRPVTATVTGPRRSVQPHGIGSTVAAGRFLALCPALHVNQAPWQAQ